MIVYIQWALLTPSAKLPMLQVGIPSESLVIAFESEAAALLTMEQELCRLEKNQLREISHERCTGLNLET